MRSRVFDIISQNNVLELNNCTSNWLVNHRPLISRPTAGPGLL